MNDQTRKCILGLVRIDVFLACFIFVPAWSLAYWEGWLYLGLFSISMPLVTGYFIKHDPALMERRMRTGPSAEPERPQQIIQSITAALLCALFIVSGLEHRIHGSAVPPAAALAANLVVLFSTYVVFRSFQENSYAASIVRVEANQPVISTGPYARVRHPMYAGSIAGFLATPLAMGSLWGLLPAVLLCTAITARLLHEERFLSKNLPGYPAYCQQTRHRLIPYVW